MIEYHIYQNECPKEFLLKPQQLIGCDALGLVAMEYSCSTLELVELQPQLFWIKLCKVFSIDSPLGLEKYLSKLAMTSPVFSFSQLENYIEKWDIESLFMDSEISVSNDYFIMKNFIRGINPVNLRKLVIEAKPQNLEDAINLTIKLFNMQYSTQGARSNYWKVVKDSSKVGPVSISPDSTGHLNSPCRVPCESVSQSPDASQVSVFSSGRPPRSSVAAPGVVALEASRIPSQDSVPSVISCLSDNFGSFSPKLSKSGIPEVESVPSSTSFVIPSTFDILDQKILAFQSRSPLAPSGQIPSASSFSPTIVSSDGIIAPRVRPEDSPALTSSSVGVLVEKIPLEHDIAVPVIPQCDLPEFSSDQGSFSSYSSAVIPSHCDKSGDGVGVCRMSLVKILEDTDTDLFQFGDIVFNSGKFDMSSIELVSVVESSTLPSPIPSDPYYILDLDIDSTSGVLVSNIDGFNSDKETKLDLSSPIVDEASAIGRLASDAYSPISSTISKIRFCDLDFSLENIIRFSKFSCSCMVGDISSVCLQNIPYSFTNHREISIDTVFQVQFDIFLRTGVG
jgi:hypothetical protein